MGLVSKSYTFSASATIVAAEHNTNFDTLYTLVNGNLNTANISPTAGIVDTQLAQITTASKVSGASFTALASIPSGAGDIPAANAKAITRKAIVLKVINDTDTLSIGDAKMYFTIPPELNGMNLVDADAHVYTASTSGTPTIQIHNLTDTEDMLSTRITIDANETDSSTAAAAPVIDTDHDDVATADVLRVDVDVAGTGTIGLEVRLAFQTP